MKNILFISTKFKHHARVSGYDQLVAYYPNSITIGNNELKPSLPWWSRYKWLYEFVGLKYTTNVELVHVLYGEEYLRFSPYLYGKIPVVATFHQPPGRLENELRRGGSSGRVYRMTHRLTKNRFRLLSAAIVLEESQKELLSEFMPSKNIHVIYHGVNTNYFKPYKGGFDKAGQPIILTIGQWERNWEDYIKVVNLAAKIGLNWKFVVVNRNLPEEVIRELTGVNNFEYFRDASDEQLLKLYQTSKLMFLPLYSGAGNNAVMESLACGCPIVSTDVFHPNYQIRGDFIKFYTSGDIQSAIERMKEFAQLEIGEYNQVSAKSTSFISQFDWENIASRTAEVYSQVTASKLYNI